MLRGLAALFEHSGHVHVVFFWHGRWPSEPVRELSRSGSRWRSVTVEMGAAFLQHQAEICLMLQAELLRLRDEHHRLSTERPEPSTSCLLVDHCRSTCQLSYTQRQVTRAHVSTETEVPLNGKALSCSKRGIALRTRRCHPPPRFETTRAVFCNRQARTPQVSKLREDTLRLQLDKETTQRAQDSLASQASACFPLPNHNLTLGPLSQCPTFFSP